MRALFASLPLVMLLTACSSDKAMIDTSQSLIMESSVLSAGILTSKPTISEQSGQQRAASVLENQQSKPVTVHYRFTGMTIKGWRSNRSRRRAPLWYCQISGLRSVRKSAI